jgi:hypothetical protein
MRLLLFLQNDFMMSWEGHGQVSESKDDPYPSARLLVAHRCVVPAACVLRAWVWLSDHGSGNLSLPLFQHYRRDIVHDACLQRLRVAGCTAAFNPTPITHQISVSFLTSSFLTHAFRSLRLHLLRWPCYQWATKARFLVQGKESLAP